jgi:hypothetical protein
VSDELAMNPGLLARAAGAAGDLASQSSTLPARDRLSGDNEGMDAPTVGQLKLEEDVSAAHWIMSSVHTSVNDVGSLVPDTFAAYARVFHPAYRRTHNATDAGLDAPLIRWGSEIQWEREVRWSEVAATNGRVAHPAIQWPAITGLWPFVGGAHQEGVWDTLPAAGSLPARLLARLAELLRTHTDTPDCCYMAVWSGFGDLPFPVRGIKKIRIRPDRSLVMFSGPLSAASTDFSADLRSPYQSANLWWPSDNAWCVATDVDLISTFVGGTEACIESIVAARDLEAMRVTADQPLDHYADTANPLPADRPNDRY